jgi:hypothetical protein
MGDYLGFGLLALPTAGRDLSIGFKKMVHLC